MNRERPIWSDGESPLPRTRESLAVVPLHRYAPGRIWGDHQESRFVTPQPDPKVELHATVREFEDHYLMACDDNWLE